MRSRQDIETELLLLRCRHKDTNAFTELTKIWERRLLYFLRRMVGSEEDAWDVLQEVWLRVWSKMGSLRDNALFRPWLYQVAHNAAVSHVRKQSRFECAEEIPDTAVPEREPAFDPGEAARIHRGLDQLGTAHRQVLTLFFLEEFSHFEIAGILDIPVGTVKSRLFHAKHALRAVLDAENRP